MHISFSALLLLLIAWLCPPVQALQALRFTEPNTAQKHIFAQMDHITITKHYIATIDLNSDGLAEYILKPRTCTDALCDYKIYAHHDGTAILLGSIRAKTITAGNGYTHGKRDILAYDDNHNDFSHDVYIWNPRQARYSMKQDGDETQAGYE